MLSSIPSFPANQIPVDESACEVKQPKGDSQAHPGDLVCGAPVSTFDSVHCFTRPDSAGSFQRLQIQPGTFTKLQTFVRGRHSARIFKTPTPRHTSHRVGISMRCLPSFFLRPALDRPGAAPPSCMPVTLHLQLPYTSNYPSGFKV